EGTQGFAAHVRELRKWHAARKGASKRPRSGASTAHIVPVHDSSCSAAGSERCARWRYLSPVMAPRAFALFDTPLGPCAVAWNERAIVGVQLPESEPAATRRRMQTRFPDAVERTPPEPIQRSIDAMVALLRGEPRDLRDLPLEL